MDSIPIPDFPLSNCEVVLPKVYMKGDNRKRHELVCPSDSQLDGKPLSLMQSILLHISTILFSFSCLCLAPYLLLKMRFQITPIHGAYRSRKEVADASLFTGLPAVGVGLLIQFLSSSS